MFPIISGTIHSIGKLQEMNQKWLQKKESGNWRKEDLTPEEQQIERLKEQLEENAEAQRKSQEMFAVTNKIQSGQTLTEEEISYLRQNNPQALKDYEEIKLERECYERQLRNCRTKEEAERVKQQKMGSFLVQAKEISTNPSIPEEKKRALMAKLVGKLNNVQDAHFRFTKSLTYMNLPTDEELAEEEKSRNPSNIVITEEALSKEEEAASEQKAVSEEEAAAKPEAPAKTEPEGGIETVPGPEPLSATFEEVKAVMDAFWRKQRPKAGKVDVTL